MSITVPLAGFGGGGGTSLNFDVKAYPTEEALIASTPKANTIGIITEERITSWTFSATEPSSPTEGMVWITVGTESEVAFNVLKKNAVQLYPVSAKQYVDGAWVDVTAMSYQDGAWAEWRDYIIQSGKPAKWGFGAQLRSGVSVEVTQNADFITVVSNKDAQGGTATNTKVDLSNYSYIIADIDVISVVTGGSSTADQGVCLAVTNGINAGSLTDYRGNIVSTAMTVALGRQSLMLPVTELSGEYYVGFLFGADTKNTSTINIYSLGLAR